MANTKMSAKGIDLFFSYSHKDEELRDELEKHLSILKHRGLISAWHDRKICAGEEWNGEIDEHLNSAQIILLLISSDFLASKYCYDIEMKRAMERHNSEEACVIPIILRHTYWEGSPFSKLQALPTNAEPVKDGNWRSIDAAFKDVAEGIERVIISFDPKNTNSNTGMTPRNNGQKIIIVDQMQGGDFATITDAIEAATIGSRILVRLGVYDEGLVIDKPLEIMGDGNLGDVVIRAVGKSAILFKATKGRISNLTLIQNDDLNGVDVAQGFLEVECCDITSNSSACISAHGNAYLKVVGSKIHNGKKFGIVIQGDCQGTIEDNDIYGNSFAGVVISDASSPTVKRNKIYDGNYAGIIISGMGKTIIEDNDIYRNASIGVAISDASTPMIKCNKIHDGNYAGITISGMGKTTIEDNDIYRNASIGVAINEGGCPTIRRNKIHDGNGIGITIQGKSQGTIEDNDIYGNVCIGIGITEGSCPTIKRNKVHDGNGIGIIIQGNSQGTIEDNDIYENENSGVLITEGSCPTIKRNKIHDGKNLGILIHGNGQGTIEDNDIYGNALAGVAISGGSGPTIKGNKIRNGKGPGIMVSKNGLETIEDNDMYGNAFNGVVIT